MAPDVPKRANVYLVSIVTLTQESAFVPLEKQVLNVAKIALKVLMALDVPKRANVYLVSIVTPS